MTLDEIRAAKADTASAIARAIGEELDAFRKRTGIVPTGVSVEILSHSTFGHPLPDFSIVQNVDIDCGRI